MPDPAGPPQEVEFKLLATAPLAPAEVEATARGLGLQVGVARDVRQLDRYFDTASLDLLRRGGALRLRGGAGAARLCFKGRAEPEGAAVRRVELEVPAPSAADPVHAWELPEPVRGWAEPLALSRPMLEIARLENHRLRYDLGEPLSAAEAELCIDRVRVLSKDGPVGAFVEVEIESKSGSVEAFAPLVEALAQRLGLEASRHSKLERALLAAGRALPQPGRRKPELRPEMAFREAATRVFRVHFEALRAAEPVARMGDDDEGVHRTRVATRRMRAAFRVFRDAFPPGRLDAAKRLFGSTGRALGPVRDLDVMLQRLPRLSLDLPEPLAGELEPLFHLLVERRDAERRRMLAYLGSHSRLRATERFERFLERNEQRYGIGGGAPVRRRRGPGERPASEVAPALLHAAARRVFKKGDRIDKHAPPEALHDLRIAVKRLRYTAESLSDLVPPDLATWLRRTSELQELLGAYNDARVMEARLTHWVDTAPGRKLPRKTLLAVGGLLGVQERRAREARKAFRREWREFSKDKWRKRILAASAPPAEPEPKAAE